MSAKGDDASAAPTVAPGVQPLVEAAGALPCAWGQLGPAASGRLVRCLPLRTLRQCRSVSRAWQRLGRVACVAEELWHRDLDGARRGEAWRALLLDGLSLETRSGPRHASYESLCQTPSPYDEVITRDIGRTLPREDLFREKFGKGQGALFRLLRALAVHFWDIGYVQSLNFVVATLIGVFPDDEALVFHCARALLFRHTLADFYRPRFPKLGVVVWQFDRIVEGFLPEIHQALQQHGVTAEYYAMQWFLALYAGDLPQPVVRRVWDRFLIAGWRVIVQVGLALLQQVQDELLAFDTCEVLTFLKRFVRLRQYKPAELLHRAGSFQVTHRMLSELEAAYGWEGGVDALLPAPARPPPAGSQAGEPSTVLPFLLHNLDTGETTVMEEEWSTYLREVQQLPSPGTCGSFWLEGRRRQALRALGKA